jgi:hypothetical protein
VTRSNVSCSNVIAEVWGRGLSVSEGRSETISAASQYPDRLASQYPDRLATPNQELRQLDSESKFSALYSQLQVDDGVAFSPPS